MTFFYNMGPLGTLNIRAKPPQWQARSKVSWLMIGSLIRWIIEPCGEHGEAGLVKKARVL